MADEHDFASLSEERKRVLRLRGVLIALMAMDSLWFGARSCVACIRGRCRAAIRAIVGQGAETPEGES